ncbi:MAG: TrkH family potassium uptake protein [Coriobacteriales bacterium]|jgi:trk system potassium uptake protein TrkH|nr:TrkH family potassium uptake protein [Coriobacteriales bacterium]
MWPHFNRNDLRIIAHYLGLLITTLGFILVAPLAVSILYGEWAVTSHYLFGIGVALTLGALLRLAKIEPRRMERKHAIFITGMIWILGAVIAAVPLYLSGHYANFLDAIFEGVSGLTATGLSLAQDVDHMSMADNMWRFTMQFVGGQGVVVVALSLGIFTRTGNALYTSEARDESVVPNVKKTARFILQFSSAAVIIGTIIATVILTTIGMEPLRGFFHALWITIGAYDTGGFAPVSLSLIPYHSWSLEVVTMLLMLLGALSFAVVAQVHKGNWRELVKDIEVRTLALWTIGMVVVFVSALSVGNFLTDYSGLMRRGIFTIISATANTGFQVLTTAQITTLLPSGAFLLLAISMAIGGSSASTAGGIKALRVGLIFKGIGVHIRRIMQPRSAQVNTYYNHIGRHQLAPELLSSALIIASLYVVSYIFGALVGIAYGYEALFATFESISAASNAGLSSGIVCAGMPVPLEIIYILQMWLGRLEFITLLALFASLIASLLPRRKPRREKPKRAGKFYTQGSVHTKGLVVVAILVAGALMLAPLSTAFADVAAADLAATDLAKAKPAAANLPIDDPAAVDDAWSAPKEVSISELTRLPASLDHARVVFEGEVLGDRINGGEDFVWITLGDGGSAVSALLPREFESQIQYYGGYAHEGTHLRVLGEFQTACDQHDGVSDVHITNVLEVTAAGGERVSSVNPVYLAVGLALIALAAALLYLYNYLSKRRR